MIPSHALKISPGPESEECKYEVQLDAERSRYWRQIRIDGFGLDGQARLRATTVMISRTGGVGGTAAVNMAMAGVGRIILVHGGTLHSEHLNRWMWAGPGNVGSQCPEALAAHIRTINPNVEVITITDNVSEHNVADLVSRCDVIIDGAPIFEERYLMHREAVRQKKNIVMGAMYSTEGYVTTYVPGETACMSCIYPAKPDYWTDPDVFPAIAPGPLMVGSMCAMEAIKVVTGFGKPLKNILWYFDLYTGIVKRLAVRRMPDCEVCS